MDESAPPTNRETSPAPLPPVAASRYAVFLMVAGLACLLDLVTKSWVFSWDGKLTGHVDWLWPGYVGIQTSLNEGALFGMGQGQVFWFAALSCLAVVAIPLWLFAWRAAHDWTVTLCLGFVMGGVLGNLYDRLGMPGELWPGYHPHAGETVYAVRDWILLQLSDAWRWPNFNLADSFLVVGALVLMLRAFTEPAPRDAALRESETTQEGPAHSGRS
ncbi:signal peptidase II [Pseudobythopirellula maris]|nr:signal peptidase II [Pseudobythopirellula maris]